MIGVGLTVWSGQGALTGTPPGPTVQTLPTVDSGIARVGTLLSATGGTYAASGGGSVSVVREWLSAGAVSATGLTDTPVLADHGNSFIYRETATETGGTNPGTAPPVQILFGNVIHIAPSAAGGLADLNLLTGVAMTPVDVSADFTGEDLTIALTGGTLPTGLAFDGTTLSGTPTATASPTLTFTGSNSGGSDATAFQVTVGAAMVTADVSPTMGALVDGDDIATETGVNGTYSSNVPGETFGAPLVEYQIDGAAWTASPGAAMVGEVIAKRVTVTGSLGTVGEFTTSTVTVSAAPAVPVQGGTGFNGTDTIGVTSSEVPVTLFVLADDNSTRTGPQVVTGGGLFSTSALVSTSPDSVGIDISLVSKGDHYLHRVLQNAALGLSNVISVLYSFPGSVPATMAAPTVTTVDDDSVSVDLAAAPAQGSDPITEYDVRWSLDDATWTEVLDVPDPVALVGFDPSTEVFVQSRAKNVVGPAAAWSPSDSDTTDAASGGATPGWKASGAGIGSGSSLNVAWPAGHAIGDMGVLINEMRGSDATNPTPAGWTLFGTAATGGGSGDTKVVVYTRVATSAAEAVAALTNDGNHQSGQIHTIDGASSVIQLGSSSSGNGTAITVTGGTTAGANRLILVIVANETDTATDQIAAWVNSDLTSVTDRGGAQVINGAGGGFDVMTGEKAVAGSVGDTTATKAASSDWVGIAMEFAA